MSFSLFSSLGVLFMFLFRLCSCFVYVLVLFCFVLFCFVLFCTEVFLGKPYNETVDTFSFCVLCWHILALETPYEGFTVKMFEKSVMKEGTRPKINDQWGVTICNLLQQGFVGTATTRPYMVEICEQLREEINKLSDDEIVDIVDASRKSQMSAR
jgi:hypothetical protein